MDLYLFANLLLAGEFHAYVREASCPVDPYASVVLDRPWILFATQSMELGWSLPVSPIFFNQPHLRSSYWFHK